MDGRLTTNWNSTGAPVARYVHGLNIDEPLAMLRSSVTSYYEADGLGSITSLSNSSGSIANTYSYDSFGNSTGTTGSLTNPFRFTAREYESENAIYFLPRPLLRPLHRPLPLRRPDWLRRWGKLLSLHVEQSTEFP